MTTTALALALAFAAGVVISPEPGAAPTNASGDAARKAAVAQLDAAQLAWRNSCPKPGPHGLCVTFAAPPSREAAGACGSPRMGTAVVTSRGNAGQKAHADLVAALAAAESVAAYCNALERQSASPEKVARTATEYCVDMAAQHSVTGAAVDGCRALADSY